PLRCRAPTSRDENPKYLPIFISLQSSENPEKHVRISGSFSSVFHGQSGYIVAGSIYSMLDRPIPQVIEGISTIVVYQRWFEGFSPIMPMSNSVEFSSNKLSPFVALLLCILTASLCYLVGRVYIENWLTPNLISHFKQNNPDSISKKAE
ncbi:hypothetical protein BB560_006074, partial [Smittium megazygosporum]